MNCTKAEIVDRIADATGIMKLETEAIVDGFLKTVKDVLKNGTSIELRGFGTFSVKHRKSHIGRNPKTGKIIPVDSYFTPHFKVSKELKSTVNETMQTRRNGNR